MMVSVVIATKNRPQELRTTVDSLLAQTRPADEVIVIDQSTGPASRLSVQSALSRGGVSKSTPVLKYKLDRSVPGAGAARNVGIDLARGEILVFIDDDVILEAHFLEELLLEYGRDPEVAGVSGIITNYTKPGFLHRILLALFWRGPFHDERQPIYWAADDLRDAQPQRVRKFGTTGMSLRRTALGAVRFDEVLRGAWPGEDVDLCCRLGDDAKLVISPRARFEHLRTPTNRRPDHWIKRDVQAMHYLYWRNWSDRLENRLYFAWLNLGYGFLATLASLRRRSFEPWAMMLQARKEAAIHRKAPPSSGRR